MRRQPDLRAGLRLLAILILVLPLAGTVPLDRGTGLAAPLAANAGYARLDSLIATRLVLTRRTTDDVEAVANALRSKRLRCGAVTIALPALGEVTPISATPAPSATAAVTATMPLSATTVPTATTVLTSAVPVTGTVVPTVTVAATTTVLPAPVASPTATVTLSTTPVLADATAVSATATITTTPGVTATATVTVTATPPPPTATPVVVTVTLGHVATRRALFSTLGLAPHLGELAPELQPTSTPLPGPMFVPGAVGLLAAPPGLSDRTGAANGEWQALARRQTLLAKVLPVRTSDLLRALIRSLLQGPSGHGAGLLTLWMLPPSRPAPLDLGAVYAFSAPRDETRSTAAVIRVSAGTGAINVTQSTHVMTPSVLASLLATPTTTPAVPTGQPALALRLLLHHRPSFLDGAASFVADSPARGESPASSTGTPTATLEATGTPTETVTPGPTATPEVTPTGTAVVVPTAQPSPTPANTLLITETTGSLTILTLAGSGHAAYDADERTRAVTLASGTGHRHRHQKPRYFKHLWVNMVLVSRWDAAAADRAAAILRSGCRGSAAPAATQLGADLQALARVQIRGDNLNAQLRTRYRGVYGAFLGALEEVALRNLNRRTWWYGFVQRYRAYLGRYRVWEAHERAYWRWRAAEYAHLRAVAAWHARQNAYDRYAMALDAYRAALPGYHAAVLAGQRSAVPAPPVEPAWPGAAPEFFVPEPARLPRPYYVPIPPAPPYMDPSPQPPPAPPEWEMLVTANLRGIGRLGNPWSRAYWVNAREDQLQAAHAFEGVPEFVAPLHGPVVTCFGCSNWLMPFHSGLDIAAPLGTPIVAAADGVVRFAGYSVPGRPDQQYGLCLIIQYNQYISSLYAHLNDNIGLLVYPGQTVHRGQTVAFVGMTGFTSGPHLHFELRFQGHPFDPMLAPGIRP